MEGDIGQAARTRPALLVVNPHSRRGAAATDAAREALEATGIGVICRPCPAGGGLPGLIREMAGEVGRVVVGGGDGSLNAAVPGLLATGLPLGILPLGTANDLARTLGIPEDPVEAARIVAAGRLRRIDLGEVNGHPYFNVASIGFGVDLTRALTRDSKRRFGVLGYAVAGLRAVRRLQPFRATILQDGTERVSRTVHVAVGNGRHYGGGMTVSEDAEIDDGRLDVYSLEVAGFWNLVKLLPALRSGRHRSWEEIRTLRGQEIEIRTRRRRAVNADGEIVTHTPARFRVLPAALAVHVP